MEGPVILTDATRGRIESIVFGYGCDLVSRTNYHVTVGVRGGPHSVADRGALLLALERRLRALVDPRIEVFLQPKGDANALRQKLRGVSVE